MTDQDNSNDMDWQSMRSCWQEQERHILAPGSLLGDVFHRYERRKSRQRSIRFGIAAAASIILVLVIQMTQLSTENSSQPDQVSDTQIMPTPSFSSGPCDRAGSCVDLREKLARVDIGWPSDDENFGMLIPHY